MQGYSDLSCMAQGEVTAIPHGWDGGTLGRLSRTGDSRGPGAPGLAVAAAAGQLAGHIRAYSRRQRSWFRELGASPVDHRSAVKTIMSRLK